MSAILRSMALRPELVTEILTLPDNDRAELAEVLLDSLQDDDEPFVLTAAQEAELDAAIAASDRGEGIPADEVLRELRAMAMPALG